MRPDMQNYVYLIQNKQINKGFGIFAFLIIIGRKIHYQNINKRRRYRSTDNL